MWANLSYIFAKKDDNIYNRYTRILASTAKEELDNYLGDSKPKQLASYALSKFNQNATAKLELDRRRQPFPGRPESWVQTKRELTRLCPTCYESFGIFIRYECADQIHLEEPAREVPYDCVKNLRKRRGRDRCRLCDLILRRVPTSAICACTKTKIQVKLDQTACISISRQTLKSNTLGDFDIWLGRNRLGCIQWEWNSSKQHARSDISTHDDNLVDFAWLTRWLDQSNHKGVCQTSSYALKRYQDPIDLFLVDTQELRLVHGRSDWDFAALSYVWGSTDMLVTQQHILQDLLQQDSLSSSTVYGRQLPLVITDAMKLVSSVQDRYLWVDSLCIVQDSKKKHDDMALMDVIYSSAKFTIVALDGKSASGPIPGVRPYTRRSPAPTFKAGRINFTSVPPGLDDLANTAIHTTRGWTFQEVMLSKKWLYLSEQGTHVRCICDGFPDKIGEGLRLGKHLNKLRSSSNQCPHTIDDACQHWLVYTALVEGYTKRQLSYKEDVLSAFAGISSILADALSCTFLHGIMLDMLTEYILFEFKANAIRRFDDGGESMFPSWSWAGWEGPITWPKSRSSILERSEKTAEWRKVKVKMSTFDSENLNWDLPSLDIVDGCFRDIEDHSTHQLPPKKLRRQPSGVASPDIVRPVVSLFRQSSMLPGQVQLIFRAVFAPASLFYFKNTKYF